MIGVIPAAGKGIRFKELGKEYPKAILPYKNKPILIYNIEKMFISCDSVRVIVGHQSKKIIDIINQYYPNDKRISFIYQTTQDGLSSAILDSIIDIETDDSLLIVLGDILINSEIDFSKFENNNFISVKKVPDYSRWCMVESDSSHRVTHFFDKPNEEPPTDLAVSGVYFFKSLLFVKNLIKDQKENNIRINNEFQISYVMERINELYINFDISIIDFGTLEEYLDNKNSSLSRSFNQIHFNGDIVTKASKNKEKLLLEYLWYTNIPDELKIYTPHVFSCSPFTEEAKYTLEKIYSPTLREIFLFLDFSEETWSIIIDTLFFYIQKEEKYTTDSTDFFIQDYQKVERRINFKSPEVVSFLQVYQTYAKNTKEKNTVMHGDLCFSNIFYNLQSYKMKLIDPKGPIFGSYKYDLAKLFHSFIYPYDFIDSDLYFKDLNGHPILYDSNRQIIRELFMNKFIKFFGEDLVFEIKLITASLFLSMIPLHSHSKEHQEIFFNIFLSIKKELSID